MAFSLEPDGRPAGPTPWLVLILGCVFLLAGVFGHDPWKSEDAINIAIAQDFARSGNWSTPTLAGEPWLESEPLYHWIAAVTGMALGAVLPFHEGARLAAALLGGLFLAFLAGAARGSFGREVAWASPLLALGTLGLLVPMHEAQPASATLASIAAVYWGIALSNTNRKFAIPLIGGGLGATFLAGGLVAVLPTLTLLAILLVRRHWWAAGSAALIGSIIALAWPTVLALVHPAHLEGWWTTEIATITPRNPFSLAHLQWLGWFAWPVLLIAGWTIWHNRRHLAGGPLAAPVLGTGTALAWLLLHEPKVTVTLPLLPPLMLLAAAGCQHLRRGAANAWDWFGMMTFSLLVGLTWLGASALLLGWPPKVAANAAKIAPGFAASISAPALAVALAATVGWLAVLSRLPRSPWRAAFRWAAGVTALWLLVVALLMPWIDYGKTYRPVVVSLRQALPPDSDCIARRGLGASQRASLDYFAGIRTQTTNNCRWLLVQSHPRERPPADWDKIWEGHRPGDRDEVWRLYRRN